MPTHKRSLGKPIGASVSVRVLCGGGAPAPYVPEEVGARARTLREGQEIWERAGTREVIDDYWDAQVLARRRAARRARRHRRRAGV